jgi:hypothetical protein
MATYTLNIAQKDGVWKVLDQTGEPAPPPEVSAGDTIIWTCDDADVDFQFPEDDLFNRQSSFTSQLSSGGQMSETVAVSAVQRKDRTIVYAAYCTPTGSGQADYAEGTTPPKMIIKGSG